MALRLSTGFVNKLAVTGSVKTIMDGGFIDIYSGAQPAAADDIPNGTKLCTIYSDGVATGLHLETAAVDGVLSKETTEDWTGSGIATGTAGWFRFREASDAGTAASTTAARIDGAIATSGAQMNLGSLSVTSGAPFVIATGTVTLPKA